MLKNRSLKLNIVLILVLVLSLTGITYGNTNDVKSLDSQLRMKNVPQYVIDTMPQSVKIDIINNAGNFESFSVGTIENNSIIPTAIPADEFDFYINIYSAPSSGGKMRKWVYVYYNWTQPPVFRLNDPFGVSWNTDWLAVPDTHYHVDEVRYADGTANFRIDENLADATATGVRWDADLASWFNPKIEKSLGGYGRIMIEEKIAGDSVTRQVYGAYAHKTTGAITFLLKILSINITGTQDTRAVLVGF